MGWIDDATAVLSLEKAGQDKICEGERLMVWGKKLIDSARKLQAEVEKDPGGLPQYAAEARVMLEGPGVIQAASAPAPYGLKADGAPKDRPGRKPRVERVSPLTDDLRAKLNAALASKPLTLNELKQFSWTVDHDVEALLCEDPAAFVTWQSSASTPENPVYVWGTIAQFDGIVGCLTIRSDDRVRYTAGALACSRYAAEQAWKRLDPNGVKP